MRRTQKAETRGCYFISEIREGLSDNVTLYRLLKESCEYLGEHSRKRAQQKNNREMKLAGAESKRGGRRDKVKEAGAQAAALSKMGQLWTGQGYAVLEKAPPGSRWRWAWGREEQEQGVDATRTYCRTHGTLYSMLLRGPDGRGVGRRMETCICVAESLCRPPETITT